MRAGISLDLKAENLAVIANFHFVTME